MIKFFAFLYFAIASFCFGYWIADLRFGEDGIPVQIREYFELILFSIIWPIPILCMVYNKYKGE